MTPHFTRWFGRNPLTIAVEQFWSNVLEEVLGKLKLADLLELDHFSQDTLDTEGTWICFQGLQR